VFIPTKTEEFESDMCRFHLNILGRKRSSSFRFVDRLLRSYLRVRAVRLLCFGLSFLFNFMNICQVGHVMLYFLFKFHVHVFIWARDRGDIRDVNWVISWAQWRGLGKNHAMILYGEMADTAHLRYQRGLATLLTVERNLTLLRLGNCILVAWRGVRRGPWKLGELVWKFSTVNLVIRC